MAKYMLDIVLKDIETKTDVVRDVISRTGTRDIVTAWFTHNRLRYHFGAAHREMQGPKIEIYRDGEEIDEEKLRSDYNKWFEKQPSDRKRRP